MFRRPMLHRLGAWLGRSRSNAGRPDPATKPVQRPSRDRVVPPAGFAVAVPRSEPATAPVTPAAPGLDAVPVPERVVAAAPAPRDRQLDPHHEQGLRLVVAYRWNWAQRELERAARATPHGPATADLVSVREVRHQLRVLRTWPRDVPAHLALGRCHFALGLGADAEDIFRRVLTLAPQEPTAPYFLALEYAFRGVWPMAEEHYARARALAPDLPPFADWLDAHGATRGGDTAGHQPRPAE